MLFVATLSDWERGDGRRGEDLTGFEGGEVVREDEDVGDSGVVAAFDLLIPPLAVNDDRRLLLLPDDQNANSSRR